MTDFLKKTIADAEKAGVPSPENTDAARAGIVYAEMHPMVSRELIVVRLNALRAKYRQARADVTRMEKWQARNGNGSGRPWGALEAARDTMSDAERCGRHWQRILSDRGLAAA